MSARAFMMLLSAELPIAFFTVYFFWKVVKTPPKAEPDSYAANDDVPR
ncbi:MAG: hypothetical protein M0025_01555 [Elusimicrobia bacterium]|nr:hypothetical protein [Elusimicrobiota bacterium]